MHSEEQIAALLEKHGWTKAIAGEKDFSAAVSAVTTMLSHQSDALFRKPKLGLIISGEYGAGKTALARAVFRLLREEKREIDLGNPTHLVMFDPDWMDYYGVNLYKMTVLLDDIGAEETQRDYGRITEVVGNFLSSFHSLSYPTGRILATTNLSAEEFDARYGGRISSRLKDLCIPLRLTGTDKRHWTKTR